MTIETDMSRGENPTLPETEAKNAEVKLPGVIREDGMYAITVAQAEMYDLGNVDFINHYILLDRKTRTAIDMTALVDQAKLLSAVPQGEVLSVEGVENLDSWLTGKTTPQYSAEFPQGVNKFIAVEISREKTEALRASMIEVAHRREALDTAVRALNSEVVSVREAFETRNDDQPELA